jgi:hypothetical protein
MSDDRTDDKAKGTAPSKAGINRRDLLLAGGSSLAVSAASCCAACSPRCLASVL